MRARGRHRGDIAGGLWVRVRIRRRGFTRVGESASASACVRACAATAIAIDVEAKSQGARESESACGKGVCECECECACACLRECGDGGQRRHRVKGTVEDGKEDGPGELCTCLSGWESSPSGVQRRVVGRTRAGEDGGDLRASVWRRGRHCNARSGLDTRCTSASASYAHPITTPTTRKVLTA